MTFCKNGHLVAPKSDCSTCERMAKQKSEPEPLEQRIFKAFQDNERVKGFSGKIPELYLGALADRDYIRGTLYFVDGTELSEVAFHPAILYDVEESDKGYQVPRSSILSTKYGHAPGFYYVKLNKENSKKLTRAQNRSKENPLATTKLIVEKPFTKFVLVPSDFGLQKKSK